MWWVGDRQLSSRETPSGGMNKNAFVEITKLYFYEEVVDLLPIKMVRRLPLDSALPRTPRPAHHRVASRERTCRI